MVKITVGSTEKREVIDISDILNEELQRQKFKSGICNLFLVHTTAALTTADLDPGTDQDYLDAFEKLVPKLEYKHPHDPLHAPDHILSSLIGTSLTMPVENGQLVLIEFDGPREREVILNFI